VKSLAKTGIMNDNRGQECAEKKMMKILDGLFGSSKSRLPGLSRCALFSRASRKLRLAGLRLRSVCQGQSAVEFALVLPLLMAVVSAILWFGFAAFDYQQLCAAVSHGVTDLANGQNLSGTNACTIAVSDVTVGTQNMVPKNSSLVVTIYEGGSAIAPASCPSSLAGGTQVSVQATYQFTIPVFNCCTLANTQTQTVPGTP
jgi:Flp pilus assembly protein TadG